jgi:cytochrome bd ubiquinol oxidase subunit II
MFHHLSLLALQQYWWIIVSVLGGTLVFLLFVQGGQTLIYTIAKNENERTIIINSIGKKWELTFTTLVTFGGAMFASFPLFYATSFGGAYWLWMMILFCFVIQAVSYEYRKKPGNFLGPRVYEIFLIINGSLGTILLGCAVAAFFTGAKFYVNQYNLSEWKSGWHGLEAAFSPRNLLLGFSVFFLARILAALYFMNNLVDETLHKRCKNTLIANTLPFLLVFLSFVFILLMKKGFAYDPTTGNVFMEPHKYLHNLIQMPFFLILFLSGVLLVLLGIYKGIFTSSNKGIWFAGTGTFLTVFVLFCIAGFNHTAFYPSKFDLQCSLTIQNASSSRYTLIVMSYVSLFVPFVIGYIYYVWKALDKKKLPLQQEPDPDEYIY